MSRRTRSPTRQRYYEPRPKIASIPKPNCKTKSGIVSMEECIKDVIENKTKYFIIIYRDSTGEYGNVLELEDLKIFLQKYKIKAYINLWKGDGYIPFYFTDSIIYYINRHEQDKEKEKIPNILIVEKKSSWLSWFWSDYFDIRFANYENGKITPIVQRFDTNYTKDEESRINQMRIEETLHEFVPKQTAMTEPPPTKLEDYPLERPESIPSNNPYDNNPLHKRSVQELGAIDRSTRPLGLTNWDLEDPDNVYSSLVPKSGFGKVTLDSQARIQKEKESRSRGGWTNQQWQALNRRQRETGLIEKD